jgi:hypothetical protein
VALVVVVLVLAAALGVATGGRPGALTRVPLAGWQLLVAAASFQLAGTLVARTTGSSWPYAVGSVAAVVLLIGFLLRNTSLPGVPLVALGLALNALVVAANAAMPVSLWAAARAGVDVTSIAAGLDPRHELADGSTTLRALGDVIPVRIPWFPEVVSAGDVLVAAGLGLLVVMGLRWGQARRGRDEGGSAATGTPGEALLATTRASASTTRGSYS